MRLPVWRCIRIVDYSTGVLGRVVGIPLKEDVDVVGYLGAMRKNLNLERTSCQWIRRWIGRVSVVVVSVLALVG